jgi:hypothetical protein
VSVISLRIFKNIIFETPGRFKINLKIIKSRVFTICYIQQYIIKFSQELKTPQRSKSTSFHAFLISFFYFLTSGQEWSAIAMVGRVELFT